MQFVHFIRPYAIGIVFLFVYVGEHFFPQQKPSIDYQHDGFNILVGVVNGGITFLLGYYFQEFIQWTNDNHFGLLQLTHIPLWAAIPLGLLLIDCFMYWWHRMNHFLPFLWYFHRFHHQDDKVNSTSAVRFHTGELVLSFVARAFVFPLLGVSVNMIIIYSLFFFPVVILHHSNIRISSKSDTFIRSFVVSPFMHRTHHSKFRQDTDSNYSSLLPYWDMIFGSYHKNPLHPVHFGL
jgi:sterol desaturase/sphingolipid hydroxylase (fatty acid hydroxylase superfamily)